MSRRQAHDVRAWRAELLDRAPAIVREGGPAATWWRAEFVAEFGRPPFAELRVIEGGRP